MVFSKWEPIWYSLFFVPFLFTFKTHKSKYKTRLDGTEGEVAACVSALLRTVEERQNVFVWKAWKGLERCTQSGSRQMATGDGINVVVGSAGSKISCAFFLRPQNMLQAWSVSINITRVGNKANFLLFFPPWRNGNTERDGREQIQRPVSLSACSLLAFTVPASQHRVSPFLWLAPSTCH